jgi:hypothetical protein
MNNSIENHAAIVALFGKRVRATLNHGGYPNPAVIVEGVLLSTSTDGDLTILMDDGAVHFCWPLLDIESAEDQEPEIHVTRNVELVEWAID